MAADLFGHIETAPEFRDIRNTRESVAEEKARLCLELNALCKTPPPFARIGVDKPRARVEGGAQERAPGSGVERLKPLAARSGHQHDAELRMTQTCKVEGCDRPARYVKTCMCQKHQWRLKTHGSTDKPIRPEVPRDVKIRIALERGLAQAVEVGECLEWQGFFMCKGKTPIVKINNREKHQSENVSVPRLLWERDHGPIPDGKLVYRHCCNSTCVLHLACGTRADWAKARKKAGTYKHSPIARLHLTMAARRRAGITTTMEKAREVRSLKAARVKVEDIALRTGLHPDVVSDIAQGRTWRELGASPFAGLGA